MSTYTSGELAKLCNVTVRTVQYYDNRGILTPYDYSEGGRRLFNDEDVRRLQVICFLKDLGFSLNNISDVLKEKNADNILKTLLDEQEQNLKTELEEKEEKLKQIQNIKRNLKKEQNINVEKLNDIAYLMSNRKRLKNIRLKMTIAGLVLALVEYSTLAVGILKGVWMPFIAGMVIYVLGALIITKLYFENVRYICPECHNSIKPGYWEAFFAPHTPNTRKLRCSSCGYKGYTVEVFDDKREEEKNA